MRDRNNERGGRSASPRPPGASRSREGMHAFRMSIRRTLSIAVNRIRLPQDKRCEAIRNTCVVGRMESRRLPEWKMQWVEK